MTLTQRILVGLTIFGLFAIGYGLGRISAQPETDFDTALECVRVSPREVECEIKGSET